MSSAARRAATSRRRTAKQRARSVRLLLRRRAGRRRAEVDRRRLVRGGVGHGEVGLRLEAADRRGEASGKLPDGHVVVPRCVVVALALDGDAVLRPLELRLELEEVLVRFELGITLHDDEQPREGVAETRLRLLVLREGLRVRGDVGRASRRPGRKRHLPNARAGIRDRLERLALVRGVALHGVDEVRDQVEAALIVVLHLPPLRVHGFIEGDEVIARPDVPAAENQDHDDEADDTADESETAHDQYSSSSSSSSSGSSRSATTTSSSSSPVAAGPSLSAANSGSSTGSSTTTAAARLRLRDTGTTGASSASRWSAPHFGQRGTALPRS